MQLAVKSSSNLFANVVEKELAPGCRLKLQLSAFIAWRGKDIISLSASGVKEWEHQSGSQ